MPLDLTRIQVLCFDVDGTLRDTDDQYARQLERWLQPLSFLLPEGETNRLARRLVMASENPGNYTLGLTDRLGLDDEMARLSDFLYQLKPRRKPENYLAVPGVADMLASLQAVYPLAIVSARGQRVTQAFLEHFSLSGHFRYIATGQTCKYTKPHPDPILWVARQAGVSPDACLMVGDTTVDILAGKAAGAQTAGVLCGFGEEAELRQAGADLILPTTADLAELFLKN